MLELLPLAETSALPFDQLPDAGLDSTLRVVADGALSIGFVAAVASIGRRAVMGYYTEGKTVDVDAARMERDPRAVAVLVVAYAAFTALTTAAVWLALTVALALAWAGVCAFVAAVVALQAAKNATPVDDMRILANAESAD